MPRELWSQEIGGGRGVLRLLFQKSADRLLVSTSSGCYAIDSDGGVAWEKRNLTVKAEAPDGTLFAAQRTWDFILLDGDGNERNRRLVGGRWEIVGWTEGGEPLTAVDGPSTTDNCRDRFPSGTVWVEGAGYALFEGHLHRYDIDATLVSSVRIPEAPFRAKLKESGGRMIDWPPEFVDGLVSLRSCYLIHDQRHGRLIAANMSMPAWVVALGLDGAIHWLALPSIECCNYTCLVPSRDVVAHLSSCGNRLTLLGGSGEVLRTRDFEQSPVHVFPDGGGGFCVQFIDGGITAFDVQGEPRWNLEVPGIGREFVHERVLYIVRPRTIDTLEIKAFDLASAH
jgi:hypothetical protein